MDITEEWAAEQDTAPHGAVAAPAIAPSPSRAPAPQRAGWRLRSVLMLLALVVLANLGMQTNRRYFDVLSSGGNGLEADLAKVHECESFGRVPDVLYLGSSRAEDGVDPHLIDTTVRSQTGHDILSCNIAMSGSTFASDYFALKRMIEDGYAPKLIVENLFEFNIDANATVTSYGPAAYHNTWLADLSDAGALWNQYDDISSKLQVVDFVAGKLIPMYGDRLALLKIACRGKHIGPCATSLPGVAWGNQSYYTRNPLQGWRPISDVTLADTLTPQQQQTLSAEIEMFRTVYLRKFQLLGSDPDYLTKLVQLAQQHHVRVALVVSPLHQLYISLLQPAQWTAIMAYWSSFAQRHGVAFYDEHQAPVYTNADFNDPHHLSVSGAEKFSMWMAQNIVGPDMAAT
ncbi:MAG: DUF1574 family protein [Ktedonobacterales bacterium]